MNPQRKQIMIAAGLGIVLLGVLVYQFVLRPDANPAGAPTQAAAKTPAASTAAHAPASAAAKTAAANTPPVEVDIYALLASIKEVDFDYEKDRIPRDVMAPLVGKVAVRTGEDGAAAGKVAPATLGKVMSKVVSGIVWDESYPVAVVDNEVVEPGYEYADGTVVDTIEEDYVVFRVGESLIQVELKER